MTFLNKQASMVALRLSIGAYTGGAFAATLCSGYAPGSHPDELVVSDMTFNGNDADDCYGVVMENDDGGNVWTTPGWLLFGKDDASQTIGGIDFTLTSGTLGDTSGVWDLSWEEVGLPGYDLSLDFVGVLKASDRFASYLFSDLNFTADGSGDGTWEISYINNGGQIPSLSHLSLYYKNAEGGKPPGGGPIPEPSFIALFGMGLLGMGLSHIRRKRKAA